ncbi:hypothetical protein CW304_30800 [Bacillus sp. UFRGS-B20]|nr:hypothetical protein CW304_30800 [Bacillus sp. UFRGS-B20]
MPTCSFLKTLTPLFPSTLFLNCIYFPEPIVHGFLSQNIQELLPFFVLIHNPASASYDLTVN